MLLRLRDVFFKLEAGELCEGWIYFRERTNPSLDTECFLVSGADLDSDGDIPSKARLAGYLVEGLDTEAIKDCLLCAKQLGQKQNASTELESFIYYWRFDAFLPYSGAPEPPPPEVAILNAERQFYESLGQENLANPCRNQSCHRGAIQYSVFCKVHHFENIRKKTCPFTD
ncbi:DUF7716 domain-containing protein [Rugamonas rivuli]|uniref:DUF7716 domain-containing protein n=1 Tax=Rugamonas rivuli TaxID=2743358 RepID=A0A843SQE5_9BURK|nr:hypothetical protein [Rugamonas rivuli]MQA23097.1 hypothetical protein [Rugamonas rivuli]